MKKVKILSLILVILCLAGCENDRKKDPVFIDETPLEDLNDAKKGEAEAGAKAILQSVEMTLANYMLDNNGETIPVNDPSVGVVFVCNDGKCSYTPNGKETIFLEFRGVNPTDGEILLDNNFSTYIKKPLVINGYKCTMSNAEVECNK